LKAIFPAWAVAIKDPEIESQARQEWLRGLIENGINTDGQINAGLAKCRAHNSPFLPSIGQFVDWCKAAAQDATGLPSESEAMAALIGEIAKPKELRQWSNYHPSVFMAYSQRQSYDWKNYSYRDFKDAFSETWAGIKRSAMSGFDFNFVLPKPEDVKVPINENPVDREHAAKKSAEILSMFGVDVERAYHANEHAKAQLEKAKLILKK
jgi:hypothetical protein